MKEFENVREIEIESYRLSTKTTVKLKDKDGNIVAENERVEAITNFANNLLIPTFRSLVITPDYSEGGGDFLIIIDERLMMTIRQQPYY